MKFTLSYPIDPVHINQPFGANPAYYTKFLDDYGNPEKGHMGIDFKAYHGQPVYAAHDGKAWYVGPDDHGGDGIYIRTTEPDDNGDYFTTIYWHLCSMTDPKFRPLVTAARNVQRGELIGYADNTGAPFESSGDHLHLGLFKCTAQGSIINRKNGYNGCIDPAPYFNGKFAAAPELSPADTVAVIAAQEQAKGDVKQANILWAIVNFIKSFIDKISS